MAREYLHAAHVSLEAGNYNATAGNAVQSGIAAADAVAGALSGAVWRGEHGQAPAYLEGTGLAGKRASVHLRRLLPLKSRAEYDPTPVSRKSAQDAVTAAERLFAMAHEALAE